MNVTSRKYMCMGDKKQEVIMVLVVVHARLQNG